MKKILFLLLVSFSALAQSPYIQCPPQYTCVPNITAAGGITGSGTSGFVPLWSGTNSQTNSSISQTGAVVNIPTLTSNSIVAGPLSSTGIMTPTITGGTLTTSPLVFKTTTGVGTTGADHVWVGGTNGGTELMRLTNAGGLSIRGSTTVLSANALSHGVTMASFVSAVGAGNATSLQIFGGLNEVYFQIGQTTTRLSFRAGAGGADPFPLTLSTNGAYFGAQTSASARVHIAAGTAAASTAPLKFTSGTNLTTAETGAMEYNGTNLFFTRTGTTRENIITSSAVNSVSPTAPNRTITVVIDGTTYYIHAKTTND